MRTSTSRYLNGLTAALVFGLCTIGSVPVSAQQSTLPMMTPADSLAWDYPDAAITAFAVDHFTVTVDAQPPVTVDLTAKIQGQPSYKWKLPALTVGSHSFQVIACTATNACSVPLTGTAVMVIQPDPASNLRFIKGQ